MSPAVESKKAHFNPFSPNKKADDQRSHPPNARTHSPFAKCERARKKDWKD
jgi:hypothetical protein